MSLDCRLCHAPLRRTFVDLGMSPPCESYLVADQLDAGEMFYPLNVRLCEECLLVQLPVCIPPDRIFIDYAYFSSYSDTWVMHARRFVDAMAERLHLDDASFVVEVASNDGYLLQHVVDRGIRALGIEPARNVAAVARQRGIPTEVAFLDPIVGKRLVNAHGKADLVVGNNVYAHVPDLLGFSRGLRELVADDGTVSLEFPHLLRLIERRQFDTIYHEHFSYLSLRTASGALATADLVVVDVEELDTHGGSLRVLARPRVSAEAPSAAVRRVLAAEVEAGLATVEGHAGFSDQVAVVRAALVEFLLQAQREGRSVVGYGAPGKGNTLLNFCGVRSDLLRYTVDRSPHKQGRYLPGSHIPVHPTERLADDRPEYILILPWNLRDEITAQLAYARDWGARFVVAVPELEIF